MMDCDPERFERSLFTKLETEPTAPPPPPPPPQADSVVARAVVSNIFLSFLLIKFLLTKEHPTCYVCTQTHTNYHPKHITGEK